MENLQVISSRCSLLLKDGIFSLVILPTDNKKRVTLLFFWLLAWTVSGVVVFTNYFTLSQQSAKLFVIIWLGFWGYFEFKIARVYMWKRFGKEKLWIKNGRLHYQQEINGRGKIKEYDINLVSEIELIPIEKNNFADVFNQTFWVKGGERISFSCQGKYIRFGMQLGDEESLKIIKELKRFLKK